MPGHYNHPKPPPPPSAPKLSPRDKIAPSANEEPKLHNPFEGQYVIRNGKRVKRTPSTKPHKD